MDLPLPVEPIMAVVVPGAAVKLMPSSTGASAGRERFVEGYVSASLVFVVGPLAILGPLSDGLGRGIDQLALMQRDGIAFVARRVNADYLSPARYDDPLDVVSELRGIHGARIALAQRVERGGATLFAAEVDLVCVAVPSMRPVRVPAAVRAALDAPAALREPARDGDN